MSARDKVTFLESLLERVRRNTTQPRQRAAAVAPPAPPPPAPVAVESPVLAAVAAPTAVPPPPETLKIEQPARHVVATPPVTEMVTEEEEAVEVVEMLDEAEIVDITLDEDESEPPAPPPPPRPPPPSAMPARTGISASARGDKSTDIDFDEDDDRPPSSSRRAKLAPSSLDEALAGAASQLDDEHEVPIKTPPPESGPQEALPPPQVLQQPPLELDEPGMEAELARSSGPAPEQVGNTIELEEPAGPALELDSLPAESGPQLGRSGDELEAELAPPKGTPVPARSVESEPAPELTSAVVPVSPPISVPTEARVEQLIPPVATRVEPEVMQRPALPREVQVSAFVRAHREFSPSTFLDLLEASLSLGK